MLCPWAPGRACRGVKARSVPVLGWGHGLCPGGSPETGGLGSLLDAGPLSVLWGPSLRSAWAGFNALLLLLANSEYILNGAHTLTLYPCSTWSHREGTARPPRSLL